MILWESHVVCHKLLINNILRLNTLVLQYILHLRVFYHMRLSENLLGLELEWKVLLYLEKLVLVHGRATQSTDRVKIRLQ